jgi:YidC/Oxa1 family membrane protein insertase
MPIFIALFQVLGGNEKNPGLFSQMIDKLPAEQAAEAVKFLFILPDLTASPRAVFSAEGLLAAIPYLVFVALFAISVYLPQKMMTTDPQQARVGLYMSLMMLYFGWISPGGVLLYWVVSSMWQVAQQMLTIRWLERQEGAVVE